MGQVVGYVLAYVAGGVASSGVLQRVLRRRAVVPGEDRFFSQAWLLVPLGGVMSVLFVPGALGFLYLGLIGQKPMSQFFGFLWLPGTGLFLLFHGLFRRFGVDRDKVWSRFGWVFYRQVRFVEVTRLAVGVKQYHLYAGDCKINIDYNRFDYTLVYIRLLEELHYRRFDLPDATLDSSNWEFEAGLWRNHLFHKITSLYSDYYQEHPDELAYLESLTHAPETYENTPQHAKVKTTPATPPQQ